MSNMQDGVDDIKSKQGVGDRSLDPDFHGNSLQKVVEGVLSGGFIQAQEDTDLSGNDPDGNPFSRETRIVDCYSPTVDIDVILRRKADYAGGFSILIQNQADQSHNVHVKAHPDDITAGDPLSDFVIPADHSFMFSFNPDDPDTVNWVAQHVRGYNSIVLNPVLYSDMDSPNYEELGTGNYVLSGKPYDADFNPTGIRNLPSDWILLANIDYIVFINITKAAGIWKQSVEFTSAFDATNKNVGVVKSRSGGNRGGAIASGWKPIEQPNTFAVISTETLNLAIDTPNRLIALQNAATVPPVGFEFNATYNAITNISGASMDNCDGELTIQLKRDGGGGVAVFTVWSEISNDAGTTWTPNDGSLRTIEFGNATEGYSVVKAFYNDWPDGGMMRFVFMAQANPIRLEAPSLTIPGTSDTIAGLSVIWNMTQKA